MRENSLHLRIILRVYSYLSFILLLGSYNTIDAQQTEDIIVKYEDGVIPQLNKISASQEIIAIRPIFEDLNLYVITLRSDNKKSAIIQNLKHSTGVIYAHESAIFKSRQVPNDPDYPAQWSLPKIGMEEVWDITTGGANFAGKDIVVAVLDDGYQLDHPDLENVIWSNDQEIADNGIDDDNNGYVDDKFGLNSRSLNDDHEVFSHGTCLLYTSPSPRDLSTSRMPSSA